MVPTTLDVEKSVAQLRGLMAWDSIREAPWVEFKRGERETDEHLSIRVMSWADCAAKEGRPMCGQAFDLMVAVNTIGTWVPETIMAILASDPSTELHFEVDDYYSQPFRQYLP